MGALYTSTCSPPSLAACTQAGASGRDTTGTHAAAAHVCTSESRCESWSNVSGQACGSTEKSSNFVLLSRPRTRCCCYCCLHYRRRLESVEEMREADSKSQRQFFSARDRQAVGRDLRSAATTAAAEAVVRPRSLPPSDVTEQHL